MPQIKKEIQAKGINLVFLRRFFACFKIMFPGFLSTTSLLLILLLGLMLGEQICIYYAGLIPSQFFLILSSRDKKGFHSLIVEALCFLVGTALGNTFVQYVANLSYVKWRGALTYYLHEYYFKNNNLYSLNVMNKPMDNPDQRITQDVDNFCRMLRKIISKLLLVPFTAGYYSYKCFQETGYLGPLSIFGYFVIVAFINKVIISCIVPLVVKQEKLEGDLRFKHVQVRINSESLAFYRSELLEKTRTNQRLDNLLKTQEKIVNYEFFLNFSVNCYNQLGTILSYVIIAVALFTGKYDNLSTLELTETISRESFVSLYLISCFKDLIDMSNSLTDLAGYTHRIGELLDAFKTMSEKNEKHHALTTQFNDFPRRHESSPSEDWFFKLESVSYAIPGTLNSLVNGLHMRINKGESIAITGPSGCGKSSLFRVLASLWKPLSGKVSSTLPLTPRCMMFLPQNVLLSDGTIHQQIVYPNPGVEEHDDGLIMDILSKVGLASVCNRVGGLHTVHDWEDILSPGEMQRLSFARLFYHKPLIAFLDEATSSLEKETERRLYRMALQCGITLVSVCHSESLIGYHHVNLKLDGVGGWILDNI